MPDLHLVQLALEACLVVFALALGWWPRRRTALQLAALTASLLIGFEIILTHWFYTYLPWFFPFAAFALLASPALLHGHAYQLAAGGTAGAVALDEDALDADVAVGGLETDGHPGDEAPDRQLRDAADH